MKTKNILKSELEVAPQVTLWEKIKNIFAQKQQLFIWVPVIVAVLALGTAFYFYTKLQAAQNPQAVAQKELQAVIAKVGKLIVLPENETPTLATVSDPEKLQGQAFFANAKKGDQVLIYTNAKKAILYDPSQNKIVEVAPVNTGTQPDATPSNAIPKK